MHLVSQRDGDVLAAVQDHASRLVAFTLDRKHPEKKRLRAARDRTPGLEQHERSGRRIAGIALAQNIDDRGRECVDVGLAAGIERRGRVSERHQPHVPRVERSHGAHAEAAAEVHFLQRLLDAL